MSYENKRNTQTNRVILGIASIMALSIWAPTFCVPPMEHIIKANLLLSHAQTGLLYTIPVMMIAALGILGGYLGDKIGIKKAAGIGIILVAAGSALRSVAPNYEYLLAFTFIYGSGVGLAFPNIPKLISGHFLRHEIGVATGIYSSIMVAGMALALSLTIPFIYPITGTFKGVFLFWSIPAIVSAISWWLIIREPSDNVINERLKINAISLRRVLKQKNLWLVAILFSLFVFFWDGWITWAPALMMLMGATEDIAGLITSLCLWVGIPATLFMPRLSDSVGLRKPFLWIPTIILALAAWGAIYISISLSWPLMALVGVALFTLFPLILALPTEIVSKGEVGTASGLLLSVGNIGGIIGPVIGGYIFDFTGNLRLFLLILIVIAVAATIVAVKIPETGPRLKNNSLSYI